MLIEHDQELASMHAAIRTAEAKVLEAQGVAQDEQNRRNAERATVLARELFDASIAADRSLKAAFIAMSEMRSVVTQLNGLGVRHPTLRLVDVNLRRALIAASIGSGYALGHLSPGERHTIVELGQGWANGVQAWAEQRLGETIKDAKAA
jgi:hypothetical protein